MKISTVCIALALGLAIWAGWNFYQEYSTVADQQTTALHLWNTWQIAVWESWYTEATWELAADVWATTGNILSVLGSLVGLLAGIKTWRKV